jgi:DNA-binding NtrC family response regulator
MPSSWLFDSPGMAGVMEMAKRLARAPGVPVLIEGERGTGVPELARLIHAEDPVARTGRLRAMAAAAVSPADMRGVALDGTLFVEDVENLRPAGQAWITELLARRTELATPLRIIGGSRLSASELLRCDGLNQELVYSLDVGRLVLPPLRARTTDILKLARRFLKHYAEWQGRPVLQFSQAAECKLLAHTYPGNVSELRNLVERAAALATSDEVGEDAILVFDQASATKVRSEIVRSAAATGSQGAVHLPTLAELERDYLVLLIRQFRGQRTAISRTMGVSYSTVLKKISKHRLDVRAIVEAVATSAEAAGH